MLTDQQYKRAWEGEYLSEVRSLYFADISNRALARQRYVSMANLFLSSGAMVAFVSKTAGESVPWLAPLLSVIAAGISAYNFTAQLSKTAIDAADLHSKWSNLYLSFRDLRESPDTDGATATLANLERQAGEYSKSGIALPRVRKLMAHWQDHVDQQHQTATGSATT